MKGNRLVWALCGAWALFFGLGFLGSLGSRSGGALPLLLLAVLPSAAYWAWPRLSKQVKPAVYVAGVAVAAFFLMLIAGGMPWWIIPLVAVAAFAGWVWLSGSSPTGAYSGRWMTTAEALKFAITPEEEASTLVLARSPKVEESAKNKNDGLVGVKPYAVAKIQKELGHISVVAPNRSGKGLLLTSHLLTWKQSVIVLDIKGENWRTTSHYRAQLGPVHVLNPEGAGARFDPIAELLELGTDAEAALLQAANIILKPEEEKQPIFPLKALPALRAGLRVAHALGEPVLPWVYAMSRGGMRAYVQSVHAQAAELNDWASLDDLTEYLDRPLNEVREEMWTDARWLPAQSWSNLTANLGRICTAGVLAMTSGRDFRAADLKRGTVSVYLVWKEDVGAGLRDVFSLVALALTKGLTRYADDHQGEPMQQVLFIVDEAGTFEVPELPLLMSTLSGRGVWLSPYFQGTTQMVRLYGDDADQDIIRESSAVVWYPSAEKSAAEYVEQMAGKVSVETTSTTQGTSTSWGGAKGSEGESPITLGGVSRTSNESTTRSMTDRPLITADEFAKLGDNAVLVQIRNHHWLRAQPVRWFTLPRLQARASKEGVGGERIRWSLSEYRSRVTPPTRPQAAPPSSSAGSDFYSPDDN